MSDESGLAGEHDVVTDVTTTRALLTNRKRPLFHRMEGSSLEAHDSRNGAGLQKEEWRTTQERERNGRREAEKGKIYTEQIYTRHPTPGQTFAGQRTVGSSQAGAYVLLHRHYSTQMIVTSCLYSKSSSHQNDSKRGQEKKWYFNCTPATA